MAHGTRSCCDCERFCYRGYIALLMPIEVLDSVLQGCVYVWKWYVHRVTTEWFVGVP